MDDISEFERSVSAALVNAGCEGYTLTEFRRDNRECRDDVYADTLRHGGNVAESFVTFVIVRNVAIFTFFDAEFAVYVFPCVEGELISQTNSLAMSDVAQHRELLRNVYGRDLPDAAIARSAAELWLGS